MQQAKEGKRRSGKEGAQLYGQMLSSKCKEGPTKDPRKLMHHLMRYVATPNCSTVGRSAKGTPHAALRENAVLVLRMLSQEKKRCEKGKGRNDVGHRSQDQ